VLILSRLAGAAETMREAVQVNPYDVDGTAEAIHRALTMEESERSSRMTALRRRERRDNVHEWVRRFLDAARSTQDRLRPPTHADFEAWLGRRLAAYHIALFLDYDGTLTPLCEHPSKALLAEPMRRAIEACVARQHTDVTIVSGRSLADIMKMVGMDSLTYAGNHGLEVHGPGMPDFRHDDVEHFHRKTVELGASLSEIAVAGAWAEVKGPTLTFHFREVETDLQSRVAAQASAIITAAGFQARNAHAAIEARPPIGWDKGRAVLHILKTRYGLSWAESVRPIYVGDDQTDEDAFRVLSGLGATFRVGSADTATAADRRLRDVESVRALLEYLASRSPVGS
jgi:trehalose-phosphatase